MSWIEKRLNKYLFDFEKRFPKIWSVVNNITQLKRDGRVNWPDDIYIPSGYAMNAILDYNVLRTSLDAKTLSTLSAWRLSKGVIRFDDELLKELWDSPIAGNIPNSVLDRFPHWSLYFSLLEVEDLGLQVENVRLYGFFANLDLDSDKNKYLNITLDFDGKKVLDLINSKMITDFAKGDDMIMVSLPISLDGNIVDSVVSLRESFLGKWKTDFETSEEAESEYSNLLSKCLSLILYVCSENSDVPSDIREKPTLVKEKKYSYYAPSRDIRIWDVGIKTGDLLRRAKEKNKDAARKDDGDGNSLRSHMRRAHWHHYWVGKTDSEDRKQIVRWIHPILVNMDVEDKLPIIIYPIKIQA